MAKTISPELWERLRHIPTPAIANGIEVLDVRPRNEGFMGPEIRSVYPEMGVMVGYACTARIEAELPPVADRPDRRYDYWGYVYNAAGPKVVVIEDTDHPTCVGSFWGEVNANTHKALGCTAVVTSGGVRDIPEVREVGFQMFAQNVIVSHAYVRVTDFDIPVKVGGITVRPGDIIHGDEHGVILIPEEIVEELPEAVRKVEERERRIISVCQSPDFTVEALKAAHKKG